MLLEAFQVSQIMLLAIKKTQTELIKLILYLQILTKNIRTV